jgi:sugar phosphate isomerase/epimerase
LAAPAAFAASGFEFRYVLSSSMYGEAPLAEILPEVRKSGAAAIDIWPRPHGNQREQVDEMGEEAFERLLAGQDLRLGILTRYDQGPFSLGGEMRFARRLGCETIVTGARGPKGLKGRELEAAVRDFAAQMRPHIADAEEHGVTIAIENHANGLMEEPDSLLWLPEFAPSKRLAIALAPYHLPQEPELVASLIERLGDRLAVFYAWQHGKGSMHAMPKEDELLQMPGRGPLDFGPAVEALARTNYSGWTSIFVHPYPRGVPILATAAEVTAEINRARHYLENLPPANGA